ncbi:MAG: hypothetical protein COB38_12085 [Gammaproteobacteria bacterium]|nr:MAG: hypothetical protein COB38_12085 [Gammaproteobacteria bacterium]
MPSQSSERSKKTGTRRISFEKCKEFTCHKLAKELWLANLERKRQFNIELLNLEFAKHILNSLPISVIQKDMTKFQFFSSFEVINLAIAFPSAELRLDIYNDIKDQEILQIAWRSTATHTIFSLHKNSGLDDSYHALKPTSTNLAGEHLLLNHRFTESSFARFSGETVKSIRSQREETKKSKRSILSSNNIRGV